MSSSSPKPRLRFDWDADGVFCCLTRPGQAAEITRLTPAEVDAHLRDLLAASLAQRGRVVVQPARWPRLLPPVPIDSIDG